MRQFTALSAAAVLSACGSSTSPGGLAEPAAGDCLRPPNLSLPQAELEAALQCTADVAGASVNPILLVPGTATTPESVYSWNYIRAFTEQARPFCTLTLPDNMLVDVQDSAEYFVHAVRRMAAQSGRQVQVIGYSQGGMMPRWGIKYFPDIRPLIDDFISFSASNHGTVTAEPICSPDCEPSIWQQRDTATLIATLNAGQETYNEIDYTSIYTNTDEVVVPNTGPMPSSALRDGGDNVVNVALQDICPANTNGHLVIGTYDPVAYALVIDALDNDGPADPDRLDGAVAGQPGTAAACAMVAHPGVDQTTLVTDFAATTASIGQALGSAPHAPSEPPLRCFVGD